MEGCAERVESWKTGLKKTLVAVESHGCSAAPLQGSGRVGYPSRAMAAVQHPCQRANQVYMGQAYCQDTWASQVSCWSSHSVSWALPVCPEQAQMRKPRARACLAKMPLTCVHTLCKPDRLDMGTAAAHLLLFWLLLLERRFCATGRRAEASSQPWLDCARCLPFAGQNRCATSTG